MIFSNVESSQVSRVGWDNGRLIIEYKRTGKCYAYPGVPFELYETTISAASVGQFINQEVKGKFAFEELDSNPFNA